MIHEEIVTYEVAKLAKEKGFREKCIEHYYDDTKDLYRSSVPQCYNFGGNTSDAPHPEPTATMDARGEKD